MEVIEIIVEENFDGRLDVYISEEIEDLSRSYIQKLIKEGNITVNNKKVKAKYKARKDDEIRIEVPEPEEMAIEAEDISIDIVYEDEHIAIVNKPKDMVVHPAPGNYSGTLVNALLYHLKSLSSINGVKRPGIVHRIDKNTTGLLMIAKTNSAHASLSDQLKEHSITRKYYCIVRGNIKEDEGTIDAPIARSPKDRKKMAVVEGGRRAVTHFKVIERFGGEYTLVENTLETGRTHQIRVHMSYIKHPLLGDDVYGIRKEKFNLNGQVLHAKTIGFIHPNTGKYVEFDSELPEYFKKLIKNFKNKYGQREN